MCKATLSTVRTDPCVTHSQNGFGVAHQRAAVRKLNSVEGRRTSLSKEVNFIPKVRKILNGGKMGSFSFFVRSFFIFKFSIIISDMYKSQTQQALFIFKNIL